ncbi:putative motility protein [Clostridia bacterium OttesenSCG-928-F22]|nr:putative motility protein [Clostridia bacterium OttesenSCG-928-F22]
MKNSIISAEEVKQMDIAATGMQMKQMQLQMEVSARVLKMSLNHASDLAQEVVETLLTDVTMEAAVPALGHIDICV